MFFNVKIIWRFRPWKTIRYNYVANCASDIINDIRDIQFPGQKLRVIITQEFQVEGI